MRAWNNNGQPIPTVRAYRQLCTGSPVEVSLPRQVVIFAIHVLPGTSGVHVRFADSLWAVPVDANCCCGVWFYPPIPVRLPASTTIEDGSSDGVVTILYTDCDPSEP